MGTCLRVDVHGGVADELRRNRVAARRCRFVGGTPNIPAGSRQPHPCPRLRPMSLALAVLVLAIQQPAPAPAPSPGEYWQQQVAYDITARLDEPSGVLSGTERIQYVNRSPDTLSTFSLHLYLNAFRPGSR